MKNWSTSILYAAVGMLGLGGLLVFLAWNGAAGVGGTIRGIDYTQGQIPFLISGGIGGLAFIAAGLALLVVHSVRRDMLELGTKLDAIVDALHDLRGAGLAGAAVGSQVVAGRTTYHNADCHLIEGRTDLQLLTPGEAAERGLAPCRICGPETVAPPATEDETTEVDRVEVESA
jgi:hypothetical protein